MVKVKQNILKPFIIIDLALGLFAVLVYPSSSLKLKAILLFYVLLSCFDRKQIFRFLLPVVATFLEKLMSIFAYTIGSNIEMDYLFFMAAALFWAVGPQVFSNNKVNTKFAAGAAVTVFASTLIGFTFLLLLDHLVIAAGYFLPLNLAILSSRVHLAAVGVTAVVFLFFCWNIYRFIARKKRDKTTAYTYAYIGCRRDYLRLGRKWKC